MSEATHWRQYTESKTLGVGDMPNPEEDWTVRIAKVAGGKVAYSDGPAKRPMIHFAGVEKPLAAGATVCTAIANLYGSPNPKHWRGKLVTLHADKTDSYGKKGVDCIRVRNVKPKDDAQAAPAYDIDGAIARIGATKTLDDLGALRVVLTGEKPPAAVRPALKVAIDAHTALLTQAAADGEEGDES